MGSRDTQVHPTTTGWLLPEHRAGDKLTLSTQATMQLDETMYFLMWVVKHAP